MGLVYFWQFMAEVVGRVKKHNWHNIWLLFGLNKSQCVQTKWTVLIGNTDKIKCLKGVVIVSCLLLHTYCQLPGQ